MVGRRGRRESGSRRNAATSAFLRQGARWRPPPPCCVTSLQTVDVTERRFPNAVVGASSSARPAAGKCGCCACLRGRCLCTRCCTRRGVRRRCELMSVRQRAILQIPKLRAMLESDKPLRLKPSTLWGKMERRKRLEARLRESEFRVAQRESPRKTKAVVDPCDESGFKPPRRPWPRLKSKLSEPG